MAKDGGFASYLAEHHPQAQQVLVPAFIVIDHFTEFRNAGMRHGQLRATVDGQELPGDRRDHAF